MGSFAVVNEKTRKGKGPLLRVEIEPGRWVKMYRADAEAAGLVEPVEKAEKGEKPEGNKGRPPEGDKGKKAGETAVNKDVEETAVSEVDDLTVIPGIGLATARLLNVNGIHTFNDLATAADGDLSFLNAQAQQAVEDWNNG